MIDEQSFGSGYDELYERMLAARQNLHTDILTALGRLAQYESDGAHRPDLDEMEGLCGLLGDISVLATNTAVNIRKRLVNVEILVDIDPDITENEKFDILLTKLERSPGTPFSYDDLEDYLRLHGAELEGDDVARRTWLNSAMEEIGAIVHEGVEKKGGRATMYTFAEDKPKGRTLFVLQIEKPLAPSYSVKEDIERRKSTEISSLPEARVEEVDQKTANSEGVITRKVQRRQPTRTPRKERQRPELNEIQKDFAARLVDILLVEQKRTGYKNEAALSNKQFASKLLESGALQKNQIKEINAITAHLASQNIFKRFRRPSDNLAHYQFHSLEVSKLARTARGRKILNELIQNGKPLELQNDSI